MLRRLKWMAAGAGLGLGGQWWAKRTARRAAASLRPAQLGGRWAQGARGRVRAARLDARSTRRATERRLRQRLAVDRTARTNPRPLADARGPVPSPADPTPRRTASTPVA